MQDSAAIDRYFTEQVVGRQWVVDMGRSASARSLPQHGVLIEWLGGKASLGRLAAHSIWAADPCEAALGLPLNLPGLARWRRRVLLAAVLLWTLAVAGLTAWWRA